MTTLLTSRVIPVEVNKFGRYLCALAAFAMMWHWLDASLSSLFGDAVNGEWDEVLATLSRFTGLQEQHHLWPALTLLVISFIFFHLVFPGGENPPRLLHSNYMAVFLLVAALVLLSDCLVDIVRSILPELDQNAQGHEIGDRAGIFLPSYHVYKSALIVVALIIIFLTVRSIKKSVVTKD